jgi:hypothetical protein
MTSAMGNYIMTYNDAFPRDYVQGRICVHVPQVSRDETSIAQTEQQIILRWDIPVGYQFTDIFLFFQTVMHNSQHKVK